MNSQRKLDFPPPSDIKFQTFCKDTPAVIKYFRNLSQTILKETPNYGIVFERNGDSFITSVYYGGEAFGPNKYPVCLSCQDAVICTNNYPTSESRLELLGPHLRGLRTDECEISDLVGLRRGSNHGTKCWIDCQARPILVATPFRHTHDMSELSDDELAGLWACAGDLLHFMSNSNGLSTWRVIHLNAGTYRNIEHMHVKIVFHAPMFMEMVDRWPEKYKVLVEDLKEIRRIMKLPDYETLLESMKDVQEPINVKVVGVFDKDDIPELEEKFSRYGKIGNISITKNAAVVEMHSKLNAVDAIIGLNLTRLGKNNISCKTKL